MRRVNSYDQTNPVRRRYDSSDESPSFDTYSSGNHHLADIAARVINEFEQVKDDDSSNLYDDIFYWPQQQNYGVHHHAVVEEEEDKSTTLEEEDDDDSEVIGRNDDRRTIQVQRHHHHPDDTDSEKITGNDDMVKQHPDHNTDNHHNSDDEESEFEFAIPCVEDGSSPISADEIFQNGQIRPLFNTEQFIYTNSNLSSTSHHPPPKHNHNPSSSDIPPPSPLRLSLRKLLIEDRDPAASCSSSEAGDDLDGVSPDTYCVWTPNQKEMSKKSNSTGSSSKRWRLRHLLHRSHSDGSREPFFSLPERGNNKEEQQKQRRNSTAVESNGKLEQQQQQRNINNNKSNNKAKEKLPPAPAKGGGGGNSYTDNKKWTPTPAREVDRRKKSYLPYRQDLLGFFSGVNGVSRTIQPF